MAVKVTFSSFYQSTALVTACQMNVFPKQKIVVLLHRNIPHSITLRARITGMLIALTYWCVMVDCPSQTIQSFTACSRGYASRLQRVVLRRRGRMAGWWIATQCTRKRCPVVYLQRVNNDVSKIKVTVQKLNYWPMRSTTITFSGQWQSAC